MTTQTSASTADIVQLKPEERLALSRSNLVNFMQKDNQILHVLTPVVTNYVKENPLKTLGIAAGLGVAVVVLKPWRLITLGSLFAVLKTLK